jgi:hypothetical protein
MSQKEKPWIKSGRFEVTTCKSLQAYILDKTGQSIELHKTQTYLVANFVKEGKLVTHKIPLTAGVLYCLEEKDIQPLLIELGGADNRN